MQSLVAGLFALAAPWAYQGPALHLMPRARGGTILAKAPGRSLLPVFSKAVTALPAEILLNRT